MAARELEELASRIKGRIETDPVVLEQYERDLVLDRASPLVGSFIRRPVAVVYPSSADDVRELVKWAGEHGYYVVACGCRTGGVGSALALRERVVIVDFSRMNWISVEGSRARVGPGTTWHDLELEASRHGLGLLLYPSSALGSTVAGFLANGGTGIGGWEQGFAPGVFEEVELVDGRGELRRLRGREVELVCGSEGVLGFFTELVVRLDERPQRVPLAFSVEGVRELVEALGSLKSAPGVWHVGFYGAEALKAMEEASARAEARVARRRRPPELPGLEKGYALLVVVRSEEEAEGVKSALQGRAVELEDEAAEALWGHRYATLSVRNLSPRLAAAESLVPVERLGEVLAAYEGAGALVEGVGVLRGRAAVVLALKLLPEDEGAGAVFAVSAELAARALRRGGEVYVPGALLSSRARRVCGGVPVSKVLKAKKESDPLGVLGPDRLSPELTSGRARLLATSVSLALSTPGLGAAMKILAGPRRPRPTSIPPSVARASEVCGWCAACEAACPVYREKPEAWLSPRARLEYVRRYVLGASESLLDPRVLKGLYVCTTCRACEAMCPQGLALFEYWLQLKRLLRRLGASMTYADAVLRNIEATGSAWRVPPGLRAKAVAASRGRGEVAIWVGCAESALLPSIPNALIKVAELVGVELAAFPGEEWCCGLPLYAAGYWEEFKKVAERNIELLKSKGVKRLVVHCPGCYTTLKELYPLAARELGVEYDIEVVHAATFLLEVLERTRVARGLGLIGLRVVVHDPCHAGRWSGIYEEPRKVLEAVGVEVVEHPRSFEESRCCGFMVMPVDPELGEKLAVARARELASVSRVAVTYCPSCYAALAWAAARKGVELEVRDLVELVAQALGIDVRVDPSKAVSACEALRAGRGARLRLPRGLRLQGRKGQTSRSSV